MKLMTSIGGIPIGQPTNGRRSPDPITFLVSPCAATIAGDEYRFDGGSVWVI
jgi:hypothetical protein